MQFMFVSTLRALSRVNTTAIELRGSVRVHCLHLLSLLHPTAQISLCQNVSGQYSSTQTGPVEGVWAAILDFPCRSGLDRTTKEPEPTGRAAC